MSLATHRKNSLSPERLARQQGDVLCPVILSNQQCKVEEGGSVCNFRSGGMHVHLVLIKTTQTYGSAIRFDLAFGLSL